MHLIFQDALLRSLKAPERGQLDYTDALTPGLSIRVGRRTKTFMFVRTAHGTRERIKIGQYPAVSLGKAREAARKLTAEKTLGLIAPKAQIRLPEAMEEFLMGYRRKNKPSTVRATERLLRCHFAFPGTIQSIDTDLVIRRIDKIAKPGERQHAFVAARTFFNWAVKRRLIAHSPLSGIEPPQRPLARERVLDDAEIGRLLRLDRDRPIVRIMLLLLITGQRLGQIANLRREHIDEKSQVLSWPAELMKGNRRHTIPLTPMVGEIVADLPKAGLLFPTAKGAPYNNWSASKHTLDELCPLPHWTLHDLRRTLATHLAEFGTPPHVIERILAHSAGTISGVAAIYNRFSYLPEMRSALLKWESHLAALLMRE